MAFREYTPGNVALLGGSDSATLGGSHSGFMGPQRSLGYRLRVEVANGDRMVFDDIVSLKVNRRHTAMSDWSATIPTHNSIDERSLATVQLSWGDTVLFRGRLEDVDGDLTDPTVEISGRGVEAELTRGDVTINLENVRRYDAIRQVWRQETDFSPTVIVPDDSSHPACSRIPNDPDDGEYSGTPMEILDTLHEEAGMRFTVLHSRPGRNVESYPARGQRRQHDWDVFDGGRDTSAKGYANRVVVKGEFRSDGTRLQAVAEDQREIEAMRRRRIGIDGRVTYPIDDPTLSDPVKAQDKAESTLADLVDKDSIGGQLEIAPTVANPGYSYYIPEFGGPEPEPYGQGVYGEGTYGTKPGQYVSLEKISYSIGHGKRSCTADLSQRDGFADTLAKAYGGS